MSPKNSLRWITFILIAAVLVVEGVPGSQAAAQISAAPNALAKDGALARLPVADIFLAAPRSSSGDN